MLKWIEQKLCRVELNDYECQLYVSVSFLFVLFATATCVAFLYAHEIVSEFLAFVVEISLQSLKVCCISLLFFLIFIGIVSKRFEAWVIFCFVIWFFFQVNTGKSLLVLSLLWEDAVWVFKLVFRAIRIWNPNLLFIWVVAIKHLCILIVSWSWSDWSKHASSTNSLNT